MPLLLLSRTCQPEAERLAVIAKSEGWQCQWLDREKIPSRLRGVDVALYAETDLALRVAYHHRLVLIEPTFDLLTRLPHQYTRREIRFMSLEDAFQLPELAFVKPADCTNKAFDAGVFESGKYIRCSRSVPLDTPVLVSEPVSWVVEYRIIVLDRTIVTFSPYIRDGWRATEQDGHWPFPEDEANEMLSFCRSLLADGSLQLPAAFTLDVGMIENRGWAVVEFNPIWCSGLLGCDLSKMLPVLHRTCRQLETLSAADKKWVVDRKPTAK